MENKNTDKELMDFLDSDKESNFNVQNIISFIWRLRGWIIISIGIAVSLAFLYVKLQVPDYSCTEKVMFIDEKSGSVELSVLADVTGKGQNQSPIDDEIIIIKSPTLMTKVVENLGLNIRCFQYKLPLFHSSFPLFRSRLNVKEIEFYNDSPFKLHVAFDAYYSELSRPQIVAIEFRVGENDTYCLKKTLVGDVLTEYKNNEVRRYSDTLVFNGVKVRVENMDKYSLIEGDTYKIEYCSPYQMAEMLSSKLQVGLDRGLSSSVTNMMNLSITDNMPDRAVDILNTLVKEYNFESRRFRSQTSVRSIQFIDERLNDISSELGHVEAAYKNYQIDNDFIDGGMSALAGVQDYENQINAIEVQRAFLTMIKDELSSMDGNNYRVIPSGVGLEDGGLNNLVSEYNQLVTKRDRLVSNSSTNNPSILKYNEQIRMAANNLSLGIQSLEKVFNIRVKELNSSAKDAQRQRSFIPTRQLDLSKISRKQQIIEPLYIQLNQKREEMQLSMFSITDNVRVIEPARYSPIPLSPNEKKIYMFAFLLGFFAPICIILLRNFLRTTVETKEDIKKRLNNPILAVIPNGDGNLITEFGRDNMTESFRMLRSNLQYLQGNVIQVTSSISGEGKSYIAANLAVSISHLNKRVALLELDLRKPGLRKKFPGLKPDPNHSVVGYLIGKIDDPSLIPIKYGKGQCSVDVYFSGIRPPNPSELLSVDKMDILFKYLKENYDYVVCDSSPFLPVADAFIVNKFMDFTLLVVRSDYTQLKLLDEIRELIDRRYLKNVNIIFNAMDMDARKYRYGYGYGYGYGSGHYGYGYGYGYGDETEKG